MIILAFSTMLASCSKNDDDNNNVVPPQASGSQLMLFNLAPDKNAVGFTVAGTELLNSPLTYTAYSGRYLSITPGTREIRSYDAGTASTLAVITEPFADSLYYSVFLVGKSGWYRNVLARDNYRGVTPVSGKAWVRYINAVTDTITRPEVTIADSTEGAVFGSVAPFRQVNVGALNTEIHSGLFNATRSITVAQHKIYTILFVGDPTSTDPAKAVQVKFIENGTATN